jgi:hypothetical protein
MRRSISSGVSGDRLAAAIFNANRPETRLDATAGSRQAERHGFSCSCFSPLFNLPQWPLGLGARGDGQKFTTKGRRPRGWSNYANIERNIRSGSYGDNTTAASRI